MKLFLKICAMALVLIAFGLAVGTAPKQSVAALDAEQISKALATFKLGTRNYSPVVQHGTHLCSKHKHCGTGHLCCSGHCKAVQTCG